MMIHHRSLLEPKQFTYYQWLDEWDDPRNTTAMGTLVREGLITDDDGTPLTGRTLQLVRARLLGTYDQVPDRPYPGRRQTTGESRRFLIPGLMPWGTVPALGGNHKAGKSTVVADLARALLVPEYRFLDHFDPVEMSEAEIDRGVDIINAETPAEDFEAGLDIGMTDHAWSRLTVEHLEDYGGPQFMDLTDPDLYDLWADRLTQCTVCDGSDFWTPTVVIVDGVSAILQAAGKDIEQFGHWYMAFRRLLRECDIPNGLAVGHSTMSGGHLMGGTAASAGPDGLWILSSDQIDSTTSARRFSVKPRMGGIPISPMRVVLNKEGRPVVPRKKAAEETAEEAEDLVTVVAQRVAYYVREHPGAHGEELTEHVEYGGWKENILKGRAKAIELGLIRDEQCKPGCSLCQKSHHRRTHFWPVEF